MVCLVIKNIKKDNLDAKIGEFYKFALTTYAPKTAIIYDITEIKYEYHNRLTEFPYKKFLKYFDIINLKK